MTLSNKTIWLVGLIFCLSCQQKKTQTQQATTPKTSYVITSPLGKKLNPTPPSSKMLEKYKEAKKNFDSHPKDVENHIWYGRRTAYLGRYQEAIKIYTDAIAQFLKDARLYRHRGHRYISIRKYEAAIQDFQKAVQLIEGTDNQIEPDGLPNAQNIPVSTLHGNIWYHLGLAYYLQQNFEKAFEAYTNCRQTGGNDDNIVSSTHWLYMIQRRLGNEALAIQQLEPIHDQMTIIENHSYYQLCQFYKGLLPRTALMNADGTPAGDAVRYGLANWDLYNGDKKAAQQALEKILESPAWSSFGYLAAEQDYLAYFH